MGCGHDWHGCGPCHDLPYWRGWYGPVEWYDEADRPMRGRDRRSRREREMPPEELETRLGELLDEIRRVEMELMELRSAKEAAVET
jgi:uncharacterized small protein (DUF1192 family)